MLIDSILHAVGNTPLLRLARTSPGKILPNRAERYFSTALL